MKRARITEELAYGTALDRLTGGRKAVPPPEAAPEPQPVPKTPEKPRSSMIKLSVFLNHEEDAYLETLASTAKFSGGKKLSKTKLIEAMVRAFRQSGIDVRGVKDDEELFRRASAQLK
ncbi:MAG: hypothetical protein PVG61_00055 [Dehalococcoidia bacterium]|jgi:hypothetical protein